LRKEGITVKIKVNMKNVGSLYDPVPDDVYRVRITGLSDEEGPSGPYLKMDLLICEGEFAEKRAIGDNWSFSEKALWMTKKAMEAASGMKWEEDDMDFDSDEFDGAEFFVLKKTETYPKKDGSGEGTKSVVAAYYSLAEMADQPEV
jgi:hypothetical protein